MTTHKRKLSLPVCASLVFLLLVTLPVATIADLPPGADWDTYWPSDENDKIFNAINDGELTFLTQPPDQPVHHHHNTLIVDRSSIDTGWIKLQQCHEHLDVIQRVQILYHEDRIRDLHITETKNVGEAWVQGHTVQLRDVKANARLCVEAESRALRAQEDGTYLLQNGPFMRKFFDGYFPMRVSIDVRIPDNLDLLDIEPAEQQGFKVIRGDHSLYLDAWFEGRLITRILFTRSPAG